MQKHEYPHVKETVYSETLDNGLEVYILPKPGFTKTYATFSTKYGSIDNHFAVAGEEPVRVPDGIAHFLEHKMFEEPEGDIFAKFASLGASANAYTSFDRTVYLFSATGNIKENVKTLIDFVQNPYFTDENVEKEKGIIGQEIKMYQDNADWRVYFGLIEALYHVHPIHIDIAGTVESIGEITKETLYRCYHTFYHPTNMSLFIVGGVDPEEMMELVRSNQAAKRFPPQGEIRRIFDEEKLEVKHVRKEINLPVSLPKCLFGIKEAAPNMKGEELLRKEIVTKLLFDILFSPSSELYQKLYDDKLITDSFGAEYNCSEQYAFSIFGGDTHDPDRLIETVRGAVDEMKQKGIDSDVFERTRNKKIGSYFRMLNSPEAIASEFTKHRFRGTNLFDMLHLYQNVTVEEAEARFKEHFQWERMSVCIVKSE
ncbi:EF-P 5-aminopentanol modification-associated protein YfmH [Paenibacillus thermotolerans]|uniref:EF-P 5-aminopentanol modification-associated protein YfmH n=1 Tax=Paenibacillus thermotolerans TaxID=3027807 RepID=UPI00236849C4|nr:MULTISPECIES: pitrilysin family protein [unclassified Paenibacillus]